MEYHKFRCTWRWILFGFTHVHQCGTRTVTTERPIIIFRYWSECIRLNIGWTTKIKRENKPFRNISICGLPAQEAPANKMMAHLRRMAIFAVKSNVNEDTKTKLIEGGVSKTYRCMHRACNVDRSWRASVLSSHVFCVWGTARKKNVLRSCSRISLVQEALCVRNNFTLSPPRVAFYPDSLACPFLYIFKEKNILPPWVRLSDPTWSESVVFFL